MESLTVTQFIAGQVEALLYDKIHQLLGVIAQDYDLSHGELVEKYLKYKNEVENPKVIYKATEVVEPEKPKRAPRKAKVTQKAEEAEEVEVDDRKGKCEATTAKGLPCKNKAFGGGCFCRVHTKKDEEESKPAKSCPRPKKTRGKALEEEAKPEPKKRGRKPKKAQPEHSHPLDEEAEDCKLCDTHGNPLGEEQEFEIDEAQLKREALREIMKEELGVEEVTDEMLAELEANMENDADPLEATPEEDEIGELVDKAMAEMSDEEGEVIEEDLD